METVISLLVEGAPKKFKVFKPVTEVTDTDIKDGLHHLLSFGEAAEHEHRE